jgi:hypothetical protein
MLAQDCQLSGPRCSGRPVARADSRIWPDGRGTHGGNPAFVAERKHAMRDPHPTIATDLPPPAPRTERAAIEIDRDLTRRDVWLFAPLIAAAVALPLIAAGMLGFSAWHLASQKLATNPPPVTFASRWPEHEMPVVTR